MPELSATQTKVVTECVRRFRRRLEDDLLGEIKRQLAGFEPPAIRELLGELDIIANQLVRTSDALQTSIHDVHASLLKQIILTERRMMATEASGPRTRTHDRDAIHFLESKVRVLDEILAETWFLEAKAARVPRLSDYISIHWAEADLPELAPRQHDEKFGILEAPGLFLGDVAYYRGRGRMRDLSLAVVFLDIDDFKAFNTTYEEFRVDRDILPNFMSVLEAHAFGRGHAYRFGGDEYVLLLPNADASEAIASCRALQARLAEAEYPGIEIRPTVTIGICISDCDCALTDRELLQRANRAKNVAKKMQKGSIAHYPTGPETGPVELAK
jgi:diguanylate cyclase (GGDEF)-like protein